MLTLLLFALVPALAMLLGSVAVFWVRVPGKLQAATQTFSAGILISAIAGELYPLLSFPQNSVGAAEVVPECQVYVAISAGFTVSLVLMFGLEHLAGSAEEEEAESKAVVRSLSKAVARSFTGESLEAPPLPDAEAGKVLEAFREEVAELQHGVGRLQASLLAGSCEDIDKIVHEVSYDVDRTKRRLAQPEPLDEANLARMQFHGEELRDSADNLGLQTSVAGARRAVRAFELTLQHIHGHTEHPKFRRWAPSPMPSRQASLSEKISWPLVCAVCTDVALDGFLIGLAFTASRSSGLCMSIATSLEMGFLGLSFSASVQNMTRSVPKHVSLVVMPPVLLTLVGVCGHAIGKLLKANPALFIGCISFAIVALLFLVTQELLAEARKLAGESKRVNVMFFVGLLVGIFLEKFLKTLLG